MQHVKPVMILKTRHLPTEAAKLLDRFQEMSSSGNMQPTYSRHKNPLPPRRTKDWWSGRCGKATITWAEEKKIGKENITIQRKAQGEEYTPLADERIFEREEEGGVRYWASDSGLTDGISYEYRISFKDPQGKEVVKEPVSLILTCTEQDREMVAQREKMIKEYYQKQGVDPKQYATRTSSVSPGSPVRTKEVVVSGRCGRVTLTWMEEQKVAQEKITIKRKAGTGDYVPLKGKKIYEREEEGGGVRYWLSDSELTNGTSYEYLVSFLDAQGKESIKKPVSINLTCNERDREIVAQREKMIKEYYQQRGIKPQNADSAKPPSYHAQRRGPSN